MKTDKNKPHSTQQAQVLLFKAAITGTTFFISAIATSALTAHAQPAPLPDFSVPELLLQQQRERELREHMESQPDVRLLEREQLLPEQIRIPDSETPCFNIEHIALEGELSERFQWALQNINHDKSGQRDPALNRCLGEAGINVVMTRMQNAIIERGYTTTRVVAAPQDLNAGILTLTLIPGYIGQIRWSDETLVRSERLTSWRTALPMREGDLFNLRDLEQALEVLKRVPTAEADIQIEPGTEPGYSDLVISWQQKLPIRLNLSIDDGGSRNTGRYQGALTLSYDNWFTANDLFYISVNHDLADSQGGGSHGYSLHYSIPMRGNWLLSFNTGKYSYDQSVAGINQRYNYSGDSTNADVTLSRAIYRNATQRLSFYGKGWMRRSHNYIDDVEILVQRRRTAGWELGADYRHYLGNAILNATLSYKRGTGVGKSLRAPEEAYDGGTSRMQIWNLNATLSIPLQIGEQRFRYYGNLRAQRNSTNLIPQDQFSIGGRYTVRGFDGRTTLMGDRGWFIRNDIGWVIPTTNHELYTGIDFGHVSGPATQYQIGQNLSGMVIGLRGGFSIINYGYFSYDTFVGMPIHKPDGFPTSKYTAGFNLNLSF